MASEMADAIRQLIVEKGISEDLIVKTVEDALMANRDLLPDITAQARKHAATRYLSPSSGETLQSSFPPTVDVYHELSMERTIVEIDRRRGSLARRAPATAERDG